MSHHFHWLSGQRKRRGGEAKGELNGTALFAGHTMQANNRRSEMFQRKKAIISFSFEDPIIISPITKSSFYCGEEESGIRHPLCDDDALPWTPDCNVPRTEAANNSHDF